MDTREWFDESTYSDLTIKLSNSTEINVHKAIVCRGNDYFRKLCGPGSHFAESKQSIIELKDDDPQALTTVLRHIYDLPVLPDPAGDWRAWLNIRVTADKYLEPKLSEMADAKYREAALTRTEADDIFDIMDTIWTEMDHDESLVAFGEAIRKNNLGKLLKNARFREHLDHRGKEALWAQLDELAFVADLRESRYALCSGHKNKVFRPVASLPVPDSLYNRCSLCNSPGPPGCFETAWIAK